MRRVRVKVCGITNREDALLAVSCGADALGFIFADSPRRISAAAARDIISSLPPFVSAVGVFMNQPADYVLKIVRGTGVGLVQLHGTESPGMCRKLGLPVLKRHPVTPASTAESITNLIHTYPNTYCLLDPGAGNGLVFDWSILGGMNTGNMVIAGGLDSHNITQVLAAVHPYAVDVNSGVESSPGKKDAGRLRAFMENIIV